MSNTITAFFKGRVGVAEAVYQNDYGIVMNFDSIELPAHFDCYFSTTEGDEAIPGIGADRQVVIPNDCLSRPGNVVLHIPIHTGANDSEVEYIVYFKVIGRARPMDDGTPVQMTAIEQALALLQNPIGNIEQIVNEALAFTGDTFAEMQAKLDEDQAEFQTEIRGDITDVESDFDNLNAQFQTAVSALTVDSEVQNVRVGADNVTYTSAGEAVRTQFSGLKSDLRETIGFVRSNLFTSDITYGGYSIAKYNCTMQLSGDTFVMTPSGANPRFGATLSAGYSLERTLPEGYPFSCEGIDSIRVEISNDIFNRNYVSFLDENMVSLGFSDYVATAVFDMPVLAGAKYAILRIGSNRTVVGESYAFTVKCFDSAEGAKNVLQMIDQNAVSIAKNSVIGYSEYEGYWNNSGNIVAPGAETQEIYTSYIPIDNGDVFDINITLPTEKNMWAQYVLFDKNRKYISRTVFINNETGSVFNYTLNITNESAAYMSIAYRTYGIATMTITGHSIATVLFKMMSDNNVLCCTNPIVKGVNHRGYVSAPENTLPAFKLSRRMGFQYVETDVEFTSDGVPVLLHDATINRTARNADGTVLSETINIHDITYEQALTYDFGIYKGAEYAGTTIPTVEEFFALCRGLGLMPYVELKNGAEYTQAQVQAVVDIAKKYGMADKVSWISFNDVYLGYVKTYDAKARLGFICESPGDNQIAQILALRSGENEVFADCHYSSINSTGAGKCIRNGIPLEAWTVNSKADLMALNPYVSGITTDNLSVSETLFWGNM